MACFSWWGRSRGPGEWKRGEGKPTTERCHLTSLCGTALGKTFPEEHPKNHGVELVGGEGKWAANRGGLLDGFCLISGHRTKGGCLERQQDVATNGAHATVHTHTCFYTHSCQKRSAGAGPLYPLAGLPSLASKSFVKRCRQPGNQQSVASDRCSSSKAVSSATVSRGNLLAFGRVNGQENPLPGPESVPCGVVDGTNPRCLPTQHGSAWHRVRLESCQTWSIHAHQLFLSSRFPLLEASSF